MTSVLLFNAIFLREREFPVSPSATLCRPVTTPLPIYPGFIFIFRVTPSRSFFYFHPSTSTRFPHFIIFPRSFVFFSTPFFSAPPRIKRHSQTRYELALMHPRVIVVLSAVHRCAAPRKEESEIAIALRKTTIAGLPLPK